MPEDNRWLTKNTKIMEGNYLTAAILSSYISNYFMLLLMLLGKKYDKLWKRIRKGN